MKYLILFLLKSVYDSHKRVPDLAPAKRLVELKNIVEAATQKVIVFVSYIHMIQGVEQFQEHN